MLNIQDMSLTRLQERYQSGNYSPTEMVSDLYSRIRNCPDQAIWTTLIDESECRAFASELEGRTDTDRLPLYGIPFSVKDNIDVANINTSCSCVGFHRMPSRHADVVQKALDAGAIFVGKNSLDQFATGLSGTRVLAPHCLNPFDPTVIPGGSSSGSGVAVAQGLVTFAIGTDTGGSGRIPAAMNNIAGIKPTLGTIGDQGVVHNSRFLDTTSVFAQTVREGREIYTALLSQTSTVNRINSRSNTSLSYPTDRNTFRFGIPEGGQLEFFGDNEARLAFERAVSLLESIGGQRVSVDIEGYEDARSMPFDSGLLAERYFNFGHILDTCAEEIHPALKTTLEKAAGYTRDELIGSIYQMKDMRARAHQGLVDLDCLVVPTVARSFGCEEIKQDPIANNHKIGHYTYFVNPMDLCAVAVPAEIKPDGVPFGISIIGLPGNDGKIQALGERFQCATGLLPGVDAINPA